MGETAVGALWGAGLWLARHEAASSKASLPAVRPAVEGVFHLSFPI